ncbi:hypothetical protein AAG906_016843 [Vitis piasezkii]
MLHFICLKKSPDADGEMCMNPLDDCSSTLIITHLGWGAAELWLIFWGIWVVKLPKDLTIKPKYLVTFTDFTILLFHYDGQTTEWDEFEWSKRAIHVVSQKISHPDIVAPYDYIFIRDENLGVEHFNAKSLEISQPGLEPNKGLTWRMTKEEVIEKETKEKSGWCPNPHLPPVSVFSRDAWRVCGICLKIGVVDSQWIVHQTVPSLGNQGQAENGKAPWQGVREKCKKEWTMFRVRMTNAEKAYYKEMGINPTNSTVDPHRS